MQRIKVKCPLCDRAFDNVHTLFAHMLTTHCDESGYFISAQKPVEIVESNEQKFECPFCHKKFKDFDEVVTHIVANHFAQLIEIHELGNEQQKKATEQILQRAVELKLIEPAEQEQKPEKPKKRKKSNA